LLKIAGALLLIGAGFLAGYVESHKLVVRVEKLEAFLRFLSAAKTEIRFSSMPVESIVRRHGGGISFFSDIPDAASGENWAGAWNNAVEKRALDEGFFRRDVELLKGFGAGFGASDTDGQLSHCSLYADLTAAALNDAKEERNRKAKLYQMLGLFAGMAAAILLC
jgi:stage III sporulation protein AB